jgi:anti-anti-sigma factor
VAGYGSYLRAFYRSCSGRSRTGFAPRNGIGVITARSSASSDNDHSSFGGSQVQIESELLDHDVLKITLDGRLDIEGTQFVEMKFTALTTTGAALCLIDMSKVTFIASIGLRTLISCAKAAAARGGKMTLFGPQPMVRGVLATSGVAALIETTDDLSAALAALRAARDCRSAEDRD